MIKVQFLFMIQIMFVFAFWGMPAYATETTETLEAPILQFPVISDLHICSKQQPIWNGIACQGYQSSLFVNALQDYKTIAPSYEAIVMAGDVTNQGLEVQYDEFMSVLNTNVPNDIEKLITIGNHEFYETRYWPRPGITDEILVNRFIEKTGMPNVYYDQWIEGYHFIVLGSEESAIANPSNSNNAILSDSQYVWLEETLPLNADPMKPIFVFLHQPINSTVYGSEMWGGLPDSRLKDLLSKYPQVIFFSGHSHYFLNHPRTVYQDEFTMVNTGALEYMYYDGGPVRGRSQGLLVNVYQDRVEIKARDFTSKTFINNFEVKVPFEKTIYDEKLPTFGAESKLDVGNITQTSVTLLWDGATDNSLIERYYIKLNGKIVKTVFMKYWEQTQPDKYLVNLTNLEDNTSYDVEVYAVDGWKNETVVPLNVSFSTLKYSGWINRNGYWYYHDPSTGERKVGWFTYQGSQYYLNNEGIMQTGWTKIGDKIYYFDELGAMQKGWLNKDRNWYYLNQDGSMKTNWYKENGKWYFLQSNGIMQTGWLNTGGEWYYFNSNGAMQTGWLKSGQKWYFLKSSGAMATGWLKQPDGWYYLSGSGAMKTGWVYSGGKWYFLDSSGRWR